MFDEVSAAYAHSVDRRNAMRVRVRYCSIRFDMYPKLKDKNGQECNQFTSNGYIVNWVAEILSRLLLLYILG